MSEENSFGKLIRVAREQLGWTQDEVADKLKVARGTVNRWEQDLQHTAVRYLKPLIDTLDLNEQEAYTLYYAGGKTPPERQNLPLPNHFFTGREAYLVSLRELLEHHRIVALSGLGGIGKTQIALKYAYRNRPGAYPTALWVNAADTATLEADFASLAETLELPEKDEVEQAKRIKAVKEWLEKHTGWLLVMDNADELPDVEQFLLSKPRGHIILTTRWQFPEKYAAPLAVEAMDAEDGRQFLLRRTNRSPKGEELEAVDHLVDVLGGLALALEQAGVYIKETTTSFADYLKLYEENRRTLLDQHGALNDVHSEHPLTVAATIKASFARVREITPLAEDILHFCAFLQPDAIPEELFQHDDSFKVDPMIFHKGIAALQRYSLIKYNDQEKVFSMHRLVQVVHIDGMLPDIQKQYRWRVAQALNAAFPEVEFSQWRQCGRLLPHTLVCATWTEDELTPTVEVARLFHNASIYLYDRGQYPVATKLLATVITIYMQYLGLEHPYTASALNNMAALCCQIGEYEQAERFCQHALQVLEKKLGAEHPDIAASLINLAAIYSLQGKGKQLVPLIVRANSIFEKHLGIGHHDTANSIVLLASFFHDHGEYEQAELLYKMGLAILKPLGIEHPDIASPLYGLAVTMHELGKHEQAEALYQHALHIEEQRLGAAHPRFYEIKKAYVDFLHRFGRDAEAATLEANVEPPE